MMEKKALKRSLKLPYRISLGFDPESDAWVARYPELPGCLAHGDSPAQALAEGEEAKALWLEAALDNGFEIPTPGGHESHSGKLVLRLPKTLHAAAAANAEEEGTSLNSYLVHLISEGIQKTNVQNLYSQIERTGVRPNRSNATRRRPSKVRAAT